MNRLIFLLLISYFFIPHLSPPILYAAPPVVENVEFEQEGSGMVHIYYDLSDPDGDNKFTVTLSLSNDGGKTFAIEPKSLSGDIGENVTPGERKHIIWNAARDYDRLRGGNFVFKVTAFEATVPKPTEESKISIKGRAPSPTDMILIPAGWFEMGSNDGGSAEKPMHRVYIDAFYIDYYEVTNEQFCRFLNEKGNQEENGGKWLNIDSEDCLIEYSDGKYCPKSDYTNHPVLGISWYGARAYAKWAGKRLPTEAEWEKAARGGLVGKKRPWGDLISHDDANYASYTAGIRLPTGGRDKWERTSPVGSFPPNGYGLYDMAGNVWEWCSDWYDANYYKNSPERNPQGPLSDTYRVIRGGGWMNPAEYIRCSFRYRVAPTYTNPVLGFRCVLSE